MPRKDSGEGSIKLLADAGFSTERAMEEDMVISRRNGKICQLTEQPTLL
jgi:hypothetical protein